MAKKHNYYLKLNKYEQELKDKNMLTSMSKEAIVNYKIKRQTEDSALGKVKRVPPFDYKQDLKRINNTIDRLINK